MTRRKPKIKIVFVDSKGKRLPLSAAPYYRFEVKRIDITPPPEIFTPEQAMTSRFGQTYQNGRH